MKTIKKILWTILITLTIAASLSDLLCIGIKLFGKEKSIIYTLNGGTLKNVEATDKKYIFNFRYFKNTDKSGVECFEFLYNYLIDEDLADDNSGSTNDDKVYSTGVQLINPNFISEEFRQGYAYINEYKTIDTYFTPFYVYNKYDDKSYVLDSYNPENFDKKEAANKSRKIFDKKIFTITVGDDIFKMTFKDEFIEQGQYRGLLWQLFPISLHKNFPYFLAQMFASIKNCEIGENQTKLFEFVDYFDIQLYDKEKGSYGDILKNESNDLSLVKDYLKQYFAIKIDCYDYGMTKSSESLFNCVFGNFTYNTSNEDNTTDYSTGKTIIPLDENSFDFRLNANSVNYYFVLKDSVKEKLSNYKNFTLNIEFNMTFLENLNVRFLYFDREKSNLGDFAVYKISKTYYNSQGLLEKTEVIYG